jgi:6-phosphogluconolactonase (cycloisomerase 2 family)
MKFTKFGKALMMSALSAAVILSVTSCVESYTVGFLYVTGTVTSGTGGEGIISGFKIDHNTGKLTSINGLPVSSGGSNPVRAVLVTGSKFLYVLNRGTNAQGNGDCTTANPCQNSNITEFAVGGNGILTPQETFYTQGINPFRLIGDSSGTYLYVLDHDAPSSAACAAALGGTVTSCGDITAFQINSSTGRLSLIQNAAVTVAGGADLTYFPVPANPVDFANASGYVLTLSGTTPATSFPYTGGSTVFPYTYNSSSGQLTISQNSSQSFGISQANAIVPGGGYVYILDNEANLVSGTGATSQILPFSVGSNGALTAQVSGVVADDPTLSNPIQLLVESKGKFLYVANQGNLTQGTNPTSGLAGFVINSSPFQLSLIPGEPFGSGSGPQCLVEDPSDQFVYSADFNDSSITGRVVDPNSGVLNNLRVTSTYSLQGPATWCLVDGRTS